MHANVRGGVTKVGCLVGLLLVVAVFYLGLPAGRAYFRYVQYKSAVQDEIRFRGEQADTRIESRLRAVADSLGLPEDAGDVTITRENRVLTIEASYEEVWKLPGYQRPIHFDVRASGAY